MNEQNIKHAEAMLKDTENYPFIGDVIDQLKIGCVFRDDPPTCTDNIRPPLADLFCIAVRPS